MEDIVVSLHKQISKSFNQKDRETFDRIFKEMLSMQPTLEILKGLPTHKKLVVLRDAIIEYDNQKQDDNSHIPIYNFVVNATFAALIAASKLKTNSNSKKLADKQTKPKDPTESMNATQSVRTSDSKEVCSVNPTNPDQSKPATKAKARVRKPKNARLEALYSHLTNTLASDQHPYGHVEHVECTNPKCTYCRSLFVNIRLTQCKGHKSCNKFGWFPHVGTVLWARLKKYHAKQDAVFTPKSREISKTELPTYCEHETARTPGSNTPPRSEDLDMSDDDSASTITTSSRSSRSSVKRKSEYPSQMAKVWKAMANDFANAGQAGY